MSILTNLLHPLEVVVAWIMVAFHTGLTAIGLPAGSGWTWALSIVGLVVVIRIILIPLFVKQINASRGLQLIQPEIKKIQEKYKGKTDQVSRQAMTKETMELYKSSGTNPFSSCLPILLQAPIFFALFRVLNGIPNDGYTVGSLSNSLREQAEHAQLFGAPLSATFLHSDLLSTKILTVVLIIAMSVTTFTTQRQLMRKNMPAAALDSPFAQQQKILLYVLPVVFGVSGVNFPIGVLIYWLTTNVWTMGQQFYVIHRMPAPGSLAEKALEERRARRKRRREGGGTDGDSPEVDGVPPSRGKAAKRGPGEAAASGPARPATNASGQRQQPKRQTRGKRTGPQQRPRPAVGGSGGTAGRPGEEPQEARG
jgi:YidC/Oxa1 family membrane protein insertase